MMAPNNDTIKARRLKLFWLIVLVPISRKFQVQHPRFYVCKIVYWLISISSLAHSSATLLSGFSSPGIVAQPCFST